MAGAVGTPSACRSTSSPTGRPPTGLTRRPPFTFVTDGLHSAIEQAGTAAGARAAAGDLARQALDAGLVDEIHIDLVPEERGKRAMQRAAWPRSVVPPEEKRTVVRVEGRLDVFAAGDGNDATALKITPAAPAQADLAAWNIRTYLNSSGKHRKEPRLCRASHRTPLLVPFGPADGLTLLPCRAVRARSSAAAPRCRPRRRPS